jgi:hypothetical protein
LGRGAELSAAVVPSCCRTPARAAGRGHCRGRLPVQRCLSEGEGHPTGMSTRDCDDGAHATRLGAQVGAAAAARGRCVTQPASTGCVQPLQLPITGRRCGGCHRAVTAPPAVRASLLAPAATTPTLPAPAKSGSKPGVRAPPPHPTALPYGDSSDPRACNFKLNSSSTSKPQLLTRTACRSAWHPTALSLQQQQQLLPAACCSASQCGRHLRRTLRVLPPAARRPLASGHWHRASDEAVPSRYLRVAYPSS